MNDKENGKVITVIIALITGAILLEGIILIMLQIMMHNNMSNIMNIITIGISIAISLIFYPYILLKKIYNVFISELGFRIQPIISPFLAICSLICIVSILINKNFSEIVIAILVQNIFVAIGEEFIARGCLFYLLRKIVMNERLVIAISTLIFVFIFHSNSLLIDNLIWRLPITIVLSVIYSRTNSIFNTGIIHMVYNILVSI